MKKKLFKYKKILLGIVVLFVCFSFLFYKEKTQAKNTSSSSTAQIFEDSNCYGYIKFGSNKARFTYGFPGSKPSYNNFKNNKQTLSVAVTNAVSSGSAWEVTSASAVSPADSWNIQLTVKVRIPAHYKYDAYDKTDAGANTYKISSRSGDGHDTSAHIATYVFLLDANQVGIRNNKATSGGTTSSAYWRNYNTLVTVSYAKPNYTLTYNVNGGNALSSTTKTLACGSAYGTLPSATRTGYTLAGWYTKSSGGTKVSDTTTICGSNTTIYAQWIPKTYKIIYNANGGSGTMSQTNAVFNSSVTLAKNAFTKSGKSFSHWTWTSGSKPINYSDGYTISKYTRAADLTLTAVWVDATYTIKFDANGGNGTMESVTATKDSDYTLPKCTFTKNDFYFCGWSTTPTGKTEYRDEDDVYNLNGDSQSATVTLYAVWSRTGNFSTQNIVNDEGMFDGCGNIKGGAGTEYDHTKIGSEQAHIDDTTDPGYFTEK